ncbi:MAG: hypothetical protein ACOYN0_00140 [Phycisphaerales bacterium]
MLGQGAARAVLERACGAGRVHHCWIFHGPAGVGKFKAALAFAAVLLDPTSRALPAGGFEPEPESPTQRLLRAGVHPDLHVVTKELARFSDDERARLNKLITIPKAVILEHVIRPAELAPSIPTDAIASKVFIIDEAELLDRSPTNAPVQNSLLKTLEEPPARTVIILVTSNESMLLPTIRSRAQRVAFGLLGEQHMRRWMATLDPAPAAEEAQWLLGFASGSPGVFSSALEAGIFAWWQRLAPMLARIRAGAFVVEAGPTMSELVEAYSSDWVERFPQASKEAANHAAADWIYSILGYWLRGELARAAGDHDQAARLLGAVECLRLAETQTASNVSSLFVMDSLAAGLAACCAGEREFVA